MPIRFIRSMLAMLVALALSVGVSQVAGLSGKQDEASTTRTKAQVVAIGNDHCAGTRILTKKLSGDEHQGYALLYGKKATGKKFKYCAMYVKTTEVGAHTYTGVLLHNPFDSTNASQHKQDVGDYEEWAGPVRITAREASVAAYLVKNQSSGNPTYAHKCFFEGLTLETDC